VWLGWYQNILKEGLWDDQDLTRYILENDLAKPLYPVIFCDEAQDFTRLELELLLRLNLFSNRTLQPNAISRVPFAFAGDQFQTLNPTGFRWESIKAAFVEKFIFELDIARRSGRTDLNYRELKYNYRSTRPIVRFGNHVQAMRAALFQLPDLKPQIPWAIESSSFPVVWFRANDAEFWKKFRENQGFVVIIPCNEGEEADFVRDDPTLRQHVQIVDGVPQNVLSAGRAKGCEYPAVIVYGFGNAAETDIVSQLESPLNKEQSLDPDRSLPLQYFINRLYVAVSRPKHRLVVVDTDEGFQKLWKCAQEQASESLMLKNVKKGRDVWEDEIEGMTLGNPEDLTRESISNSLENARVFEADGKARRDSFLLKQAVQAYRSAGDEAKAKECRAYAFEADGNFLEAGDAFFDAGFATKGVHCLWRAEKPGWIHLRDKIEPFPQVAQEIEYEFANVILGKIDPAKVTSLLDRFDKRLEGDNKFAESCIGENIWRVALIELLKPLNGQKQYSSWEQMASSLTHIRAKGVRVSPSAACAWIFYSANRLEEAIAFWDEAGETKSNDYLKAKASVEPYPQRILSLSRLGLFEDIIRAWSDAPNSLLSPDQRTALADALREVNRLEDAFVCAWEDGNTSFADSMLRIALSAFNNGDTAMATKALHASVILLVRQAKWDMVNTFISSNEFIPTIEWKGKKIKDWVTSETKAMRVNLIRALARSDKLPNADTKFLQKLTKFFQDFLKEKDTWRNKITIFEAGAAMERAGRFVDAIMFYETYAKDSYKEEGIKQFARQRWSVCKKRQLDWETNHSKSSPQKLRGIEDELRQKRADWQISPQTVLKTYPELDPITLGTEGTGVIAKSDPIALTHEYQVPPTPSSEVEELPEKTVIAVNDFEIELSRKLQRCNIKHRISMETAFVKINERKFGGEVDFIQIDELHWRCEVWKINVFFQDISQGVLVIDMEKLGAEIKLTLLHLKK
jgi:tetratricopeptide (TPR) repeat protein